MIVSVVSLKGGVGKTTSALYLATCALEDGLQPVVLDADEEGSAISWAQLAATRDAPLPFEVIRADRNSPAKQARDLERAGHVVIIDTPPNNRETLTIAGMVSDFVIVPVSPSGLEVDRLMNTLAVLENVEASKGSLTFGILLTRYDARLVLAREAQAALSAYSVFDTRIRDLTRYQLFGQVPDYLDEYRAVWREIKEAI